MVSTATRRVSRKGGREHSPTGARLKLVVLKDGEVGHGRCRELGKDVRGSFKAPDQQARAAASVSGERGEGKGTERGRRVRCSRRDAFLPASSRLAAHSPPPSLRLATLFVLPESRCKKPQELQPRALAAAHLERLSPSQACSTHLTSPRRTGAANRVPV